MQLGLTIPLIKHLKINRLPYGVELYRRFCWDLHCIRLYTTAVYWRYTVKHDICLFCMA